ncbi:glycoside hydrolase family 27 protein [Nocardia heshunensis]
MDYRITKAAAISAALLCLAMSVVACTAAEPLVFPPVKGPAVAGVALTPPLGWDSWNTYGCNVTERDIEAQADAMVASGMRAAGYQYVILDDCWFDPQRDSTGRLHADPTRFPDGMAALAEYMHTRGLKFGLYESPNTMTCTQYEHAYPGATGSAGYERLDAVTFASWGVDYLKYDWCSSDADVARQVQAFTAMRDAIRSTGRAMVYSINPNSEVFAPPSGSRYNWNGIASMSRDTADVMWAWQLPSRPHKTSIGVQQALAQAYPPVSRDTPGYWTDLDMLVLGVPGTAGTLTPGLTEAEERTHLGMWAMWSSPLIAGNPLPSMPDRVRSLLTDGQVLAVDQDPSAPATSIAPMIWRRRMADGSVTIALCNDSDDARTLTVSPAQLGLPEAPLPMTDLWTGASTVVSGTVASTVLPHDTALLRIGPGIPKLAGSPN